MFLSLLAPDEETVSVEKKKDSRILQSMSNLAVNFAEMARKMRTILLYACFLRDNPTVMIDTVAVAASSAVIAAAI